MRKYGFVLFLVISFAISIPLFVNSTQQTSTGVIVLLFLLGSYAPAFAAWIVVRGGGTDEEKLSFRSVLWKRTSSKWFLFALFVPSVLWLLAYAVSSMSISESILPVWLALAGSPVILIVNYGEEIGWRGYALPYLMKRFDPFSASLILGVIWGLFHVALNWQRPIFGFLTFCTTLALSMILAWMFINTKSILAGTFFHAVYNAWVQVFVIGGDMTILMVTTALIVCVAVYMVVRYGKELVV